MENNPTLGVIGGSGLYDMPGLSDTRQVILDTPFGAPSSPIVIGTLAGCQVAFLARHGIGHIINPSEVNYRANIYALKLLGVQQVLAVSACGSLRTDYAPGHIVFPDQLYDQTRDRKRSFFDSGLVAHVSVANPFCPDLSAQAAQAAESTGTTVHRGGTFITVEGPRFSTKGESHVFRSWGMSLIGMTTSPEAYLAREAELCYAVMAHVTDYDVWHVTEESVTVERVLDVLRHNTQAVQATLVRLAGALQPANACGCQDALAGAIASNPKAVPAETRQRLDLLVSKYLP